MAKIGYARVSSKEQNLDRQLQALQDVSKVFSDKASGQSTERPQLQAMLAYLRAGEYCRGDRIRPLRTQQQRINRLDEYYSTKRRNARSLKLAFHDRD